MNDSQNEEGWPGIGHYIAVVWKHRWLVIAFGVLVMAGTVLFTQRQPRIYEAVTQLVIDPAAPQYLSSMSGQEVMPLGTGNSWSTREYFETQHRIIKSRMVATMVVERLALASNLDFLGIKGIEGDEERQRALSRADPVALVTSRLAIEPVQDSTIVLVKFRDEDPERARKIADAICAAYGDANLEQKISFTGEAAKWLTQQVEQGRAEVEAGELSVMQFKLKHNILTATLGDKQNQLGFRLQDADRQLREARTESERLHSTLEQVRKLDGDQVQSSVEEVLQNGLVQRLKEQTVQLKNERTVMLNRYLETHPDVKAVDEKIARVAEALRVEVAGIQKMSERRYQSALSSEHKLAADVATVQRELLALNAVELDYKRLEVGLQSKKDMVSQLMIRLKEAELQAESRANNVRVLDAALVPQNPVSPRWSLNMVIALLLAVMGGLGLALVVEGLDSSIKTQEELEREFGLTFLGMIPRIVPERGKKKQGGQVVEPVDPDRYVLDAPTSTAAECARTIRTNLLFMAPEREMRKLLITSAGPREGKTSTCVNIAATMAMSGAKILVIDTDMRRPRLHRIFGMQNDRGISNLLVDPERNLDEVIRDTGVPNFDIISSGPIPPNPAELLHTPAFKRVVERLLERYDRIIFDSPPVCVVTDALIIGNQCDGCMLVVRSGDTSRDMVRKARRLIADVNINILGALLNGVHVEKHGYGSTYYRYYRAQGGYLPEDEHRAGDKV